MLRSNLSQIVCRIIDTEFARAQYVFCITFEPCALLYHPPHYLIYKDNSGRSTSVFITTIILPFPPPSLPGECSVVGQKAWDLGGDDHATSTLPGAYSDFPDPAMMPTHCAIVVSDVFAAILLPISLSP